MSKFIYSLLMFFSSLFGSDHKSRVKSNEANPKPSTSIYDFSMKAINGELIDFNIYRGKKMLIVNVASECGFTPQYEDLQKLHEQYGDKVTILGFPSNEFGRQEPGTNQEIHSFCKENYGINFQLFAKTTVQGDDKCDLYIWLTAKELNGWNDQEPKWNFNKYLVSEEGVLLKYYSSKTSPLSGELISEINR